MNSILTKMKDKIKTTFQKIYSLIKVGINYFFDKKIFPSIVIAFSATCGTWYIQHSIAEESIKKDYVQVAVTILSNEVDTQNLVNEQDVQNYKSLRKWALKVFKEYAPIKLPSEAESALQAGLINSKSILPGIPEPLLKNIKPYINTNMSQDTSNSYLEKINITSQTKKQAIISNKRNASTIENDDELKNCRETLELWQNWHKSLINTIESRESK